MLHGQHQRADIPVCAGTAHNGLPLKRLEKDQPNGSSCLLNNPVGQGIDDDDDDDVSPTAQLVKGLMMMMMSSQRPTWARD